MKTVVISQPMYFPWPGFFQLVSKADVYIHLDDVQFSRGSFTNRVQIKSREGPKWMSIPLRDKGTFKSITELSPSNTYWRFTHRKLVEKCLASAPYLDEALALFDDVVKEEELPGLLCSSIDHIASTLGVAQHAPRLWASRMGVHGQSWRRVLDLVHSVGGTRYVTAHGGRNYLAHEIFESEGVKIEYINYNVKPWQQFHGEFTPYVSILDLIAHCGIELTAKLETETIPWRRFVENSEPH